MKPDTWRLSGCEGKEAFDSFALADKVRGRKRRHGGEARQVYHCEFCHRFHLGRPGHKRNKGRPKLFSKELL